MDEIEVRIHWLSITVYTDIDQIGVFWDQNLNKNLGMLEDVGHGAAGFRKTMKALAGTKVYYDPINNASERTYVHIVLPGQACDSLEPETLRFIVYFLNRNYEINITRLDVAFDYVSFTPIMFSEALIDGHVRSLAKRDSIRIQENPYQMQDKGNQKGCSTVYFGSRSSTRSLRVYDQRGYTRLEIEYRKDRADAVSKDVIIHFVENWPDLMIEHLLDFVDLLENKDGDRLEFWESFIQGKKRAGLKISDARIVDLNNQLNWLGRQVSPSLSTVNDVLGEETIKKLIKEGRRKRGKRYKSLLDTDISGFGEDDDNDK